MITVYHLINARSQRVIWLLEELGLEYRVIESSQIDSTSNFPESVLPLKYPTVSIPGNNGLMFLTETSAICEFLCLSHQKLMPDVKPLEANINNIFWKNYADASLMQTLVLKQVFKQIVLNTPFLLKPITFALRQSFQRMYLNTALAQQLSRVDTYLSKRKWMCGAKFTFVDILMWFPLAAGLVNIDLQKYKNIRCYLEDINQRPSFQAALISGGWNNHIFNKYWQ